MESEIINLVVGWGWLIIVVMMLWVSWKVYMTIKGIDYAGSIKWAFIQITIPEVAEQTPKAMENAYDIWDGIHKSPDLVEKYFDGYVEAWYSCEIHCTKNRARYIMVVPKEHQTFFEGVIYGQYPQAEITETEDYTQRYSWKDLEKKYDLYGTDMILTDDDYLPIKTYHEYEDVLAEEDKYVDPHQGLVEAYTNVNEGEEFWVQVLVRPIDAKDIKKWENKGEEIINQAAGKDTSTGLGLTGRFVHWLTDFPLEIGKAVSAGPSEGKSKKDLLKFPVVSAVDTTKMEGILRKVSKGGFRCMVRLVYIAPAGKLNKPNISRAIGAFKQFNTFNLNGFRPDPKMKSNKPNYFLKAWRRYMKKRKILLYFQWRDLGGYEDGYMLSSEELATLYHFPAKYLRAPAVVRTKAGAGSAPENVPYA